MYNIHLKSKLTYTTSTQLLTESRVPFQGLLPSFLNLVWSHKMADRHHQNQWKWKTLLLKEKSCLQSYFYYFEVSPQELKRKKKKKKLGRDNLLTPRVVQERTGYLSGRYKRARERSNADSGQRACHWGWEH